MMRRSVIAAGLAGIAVSAAAGAPSNAAAAGAPLYYRINRYDMRGGDEKLIDAFLKDALLPAARRLGMGPIGVFNSWFASDGSFKYVLLPGRSLEVLVDLEAALKTDADYLRIAAPFRKAEVRQPPFQRLSSSILRAMPGLKQMQLPASLAGSPKRIFELRHYEQPTYETHERKVQMFMEEEAAQLDAAGLMGVMYGIDLVGENLPRLTYMWAYPDLGARHKGEDVFFSKPETPLLFNNPKWAGIPSVIKNTIMRPAAYSEI